MVIDKIDKQLNSFTYKNCVQEIDLAIHVAPSNEQTDSLATRRLQDHRGANSRHTPQDIISIASSFFVCLLLLLLLLLLVHDPADSLSVKRHILSTAQNA